jgi:hypothetical protein
MQLWIAALFIGFLVVALGRERANRHPNRLIFLIMLGVIGYEAAKIHAF